VRPRRNGQQSVFRLLSEDAGGRAAGSGALKEPGYRGRCKQVTRRAKSWRDETTRYNNSRDRVNVFAEFSSERSKACQTGPTKRPLHRRDGCNFSRRRRFGRRSTGATVSRPDWHRHNICNLRGCGHRGPLACVPILACDVNLSGRSPLMRGCGGGCERIGGADPPPTDRTGKQSRPTLVVQNGHIHNFL
jgi:hypothetical protein